MRDRINSLSKHLPDLPIHGGRKHADDAPKGMSLPLGIPHVHRRHSLSSHTHDAREVKRYLKDTVRTDWTYPPLPKYQIPTRPKQVKKAGDDDDVEEKKDDKNEDANDVNEVNDDNDTQATGTNEAQAADYHPGGFRFYNPSDHERETLLHRNPEQLDFTPAEWRERSYSDEESPAEEGVDKDSKPEFKFDNPESIGTQLADRALLRKRKRQARLDEECTWNDGLAHWLAQRDAFCGAHTAPQVQALDTTQAQPERQASTVSVSASASVASSTPRSSTDSSETDAGLENASTPSTSTTPDPAPETISSSSKPTIIPTEPPAPPSDILVPVAPQMLPNNPVRQRLAHNSYPEIYSKIILQSRTPSVPINLQTLTRALVQGWKDDGEWPPKPIEATWAGTGERRNSATLKKGVKAVGRALRITSESGITGKS